jgi:hypothetical protein
MGFSNSILRVKLRRAVVEPERRRRPSAAGLCWRHRMILGWLGAGAELAAPGGDES